MTEAPPPSLRRPVSLAKPTDRMLARNSNLARLTNTYLFDTARAAQLLFILQTAAVACMILLAVLLSSFSTVRFRIFATTVDGKLSAPPSVDQDISENALALWVADAMSRTLTMGHHDYQIRLEEIRPYFTDRGWESFNRFLRAPLRGAPSIMSQLDKDYLLMWLTKTSPSTLLQKGLVGGVFTYIVRIDVNAVRTSALRNAEGSETYEMTIERVGADVNPEGLAIAQWRQIGR